MIWLNTYAYPADSIDNMSLRKECHMIDVIAHNAHKSPTPEPEDHPIPESDPSPEEDPIPHPDPVIKEPTPRKEKVILQRQIGSATAFCPTGRFQ
jgi:hypothetical protein